MIMTPKSQGGCQEQAGSDSTPMVLGLVGLSLSGYGSIRFVLERAHGFEAPGGQLLLCAYIYACFRLKRSWSRGSVTGPFLALFGPPASSLAMCHMVAYAVVLH
jgi:hypothetical protein